ncbi:MAG: ribonuclease J [Clostridia bacterium]|nr:ribonuclease J [Clostridia bacterium]
MDRIDKFLSTSTEETVQTGRTSKTGGKKNLNKRKTTSVPVADIVEESNGKKKRIFANPESNKAISVSAKTTKKTKTANKNKEAIEFLLNAKDEVEKTHKRAGVSKSGLKVIFLGGVGEIGKNITALEYGDDILLIDCGLAFPGEDMPGVDLVIPDFTYLKENASKVKGIVITHGHEDHIGSLPYLLKDLKVPVYGSKLTLTLLDNKLREHKITGIKQNVVKPRNQIKLGCFSVEFVKVNHSIAGAFALSITTPAGIVFHTGDFKIDYTPIDGEKIDLPRIAEIGEKGVTLLMCESTNVERPGYTMSEKSVGEKLEKIFIEHATRRLFVATFSSNIYRIQQIIDLAIKYDRKVAVVGRSMINNIDAGMKIGEFKFDKDVFVDIEKIASLEDKNVIVLSTGSQGEPTSALSRLSSGEFSRVEIGENDTVIFSSTPIPGNENMVNKVINNLYKKGAIVIHDNVHTSGHACQEELKTIHSLIRPKYFIPVHGEYRHLKEHCLLAESLGMDKYNMIIPEIGTVVEITKNAMVKRGTVPAGEQLVDGLGIGDVGSVVLRDRKLLSEDGLVIVVIGVSSITGELTTDPYMITRGFVYNTEADELTEEAKQILLDTLATIDLKEDHEWNELRNQIRKPLRNFFYKKTKRNPMILPIIFRV